MSNNRRKILLCVPCSKTSHFYFAFLTPQNLFCSWLWHSGVPIAQNNIVMANVKPTVVSGVLIARLGFGYLEKESISQSLTSAGSFAQLSSAVGSLSGAGSAGQCSKWENSLLDFLLRWFCYCNDFRYPRDGATMLWLNLAARLERWHREKVAESLSPEYVRGVEYIHVAQLPYFFDKYRWNLIAVNKTFIKMS